LPSQVRSLPRSLSAPLRTATSVALPVGRGASASQHWVLAVLIPSDVFLGEAENASRLAFLMGVLVVGAVCALVASSSKFVAERLDKPVDAARANAIGTCRCGERARARCG
jgi:hypothetical protein